MPLTVRPLIFPLCRLLFPTLHFRRQKSDNSAQLLLVCIRHLNLYAHALFPSSIVPRLTLPRLSGKDSFYILLICSGSIAARRSAVLVSFVAPLPPRFCCWRSSPGREWTLLRCTLFRMPVQIQPNTVDLIQNLKSLGYFGEISFTSLRKFFLSHVRKILIVLNDHFIQFKVLIIFIQDDPISLMKVKERHLRRRPVLCHPCRHIFWVLVGTLVGTTWNNSIFYVERFEYPLCRP